MGGKEYMKKHMKILAMIMLVLLILAVGFVGYVYKKNAMFLPALFGIGGRLLSGRRNIPESGKR